MEGPENVHLVDQFASKKGFPHIELFGYGAGGADNIEKWLQACRELGIKACAVYDKNKEEAALRARSKFPEFLIEILPTDDIRDKPGRKTETRETMSIFTSAGDIKPEFEG